MGMYGGSGGYSTSNTASQPWDVQGNYLQPLFRQNYAAMFGLKPGEGGEGAVELTPEEQRKYYSTFMGREQDSNRPLPGTLQYFGAGDDVGQASGRWDAPSNIINRYAPVAPTVAGLSPEQEAAQKLVTGRLQNQTRVGTPLGFMDTGYNTLIPSSIGAYESIVKGQNRINPASMSAAAVAPNLTINAPQIGSTDLGYRYWSELGNMAGGSNQNPYLERMIGNATRNVTNDFYNYQLPSLATDAEKAGMFGGNTYGKIRNDAYDRYLQNVGDIEANMRGQAYNTNQANALGAMGLGGTLAGSQADINAQRALQQANLGLSAQTSQAGNELQRAIQNAANQQEMARQNAGFTQEANIGNIGNILNAGQLAPNLGQASYEDISKLAGVGESNTALAQKILDAYRDFYTTQQYEPYERASLMSNLLSGDFGGSNIGAVSNRTTGGYI